MICDAIQVAGPENWKLTQVDIGDPGPEESLIRVSFSSLCGTDRDVIDGSLCYYKTGHAKYPIITGHEWCGILDHQPVTGVCILSCGECATCINGGSPAQCHSRKEVGVVNQNGAHAQYVIMPKEFIIPIPEVSAWYALVEPTAVVLHGLSRINLDNFHNILIIGYGTIGKICSDILRVRERECLIYDPNEGGAFGGGISDSSMRFRRHCSRVCFQAFDLVIECSGNKNSLTENISCKGGTILGFGFDYKETLGDLVSNEVTFVGSLGSTKKDFIEAVKMMPEIVSVDFEIMKLDNFGDALASGRKVVFDHEYNRI